MILWFVFVNKLMDNFKRVSFGINTPLNSPGLVRQFLELSMKNWNHIVYSKKKKKNDKNKKRLKLMISKHIFPKQ